MSLFLVFILCCLANIHGIDGMKKECTKICTRGKVCDWLGRCREGVGGSCTFADSDSACIAGAYCHSGICICNTVQSQLKGLICEPLPGKRGGKCSSSSPCEENTNCVNGFCDCNTGYSPTDAFACASHEKDEKFSKVHVFVLLGAVLFVSLAAAAYIGVIAKKKSRPAHKMHPGHHPSSNIKKINADVADQKEGQVVVVDSALAQSQQSQQQLDQPLEPRNAASDLLSVSAPTPHQSLANSASVVEFNAQRLLDAKEVADALLREQDQSQL